MARIKHTKSLDANPRAAKKQLMLINKLKNRIKEKANGIKTMTGGSTQTTMKPTKGATPEDEKKKRRWRPGTVAKREIRKLTRSTDLLFPKASFSRVVREICQNKIHNGHETRFTKNSMKAIQVLADHVSNGTGHHSK